MGDGTEQNPYTREDVLKAIEENGGTAKGLDLSGKVFEEAIDLRGLNLNEVILKQAHLEYAHLEGAQLVGAHLEGTDLWGAQLEEAILPGAYLEGANLSLAHVKGADLSFAYLQGADLAGIEFSPDTGLEHVDWGSYILAEEKDGRFYTALPIYRRLKIWYTEHGMYDIAGEFFFREMTAKRKALKWWPNPFPRGWSKFLSLICGYGERPLRVIGWAASVVLGLAFIYFIIGSVWEWWAFWKSLYFSAVSFTALGYGSWLQATNDWIRGIGAFESFVGVFTIALFLITFVRKMTR
jgi:uncharacterized protein YjeT (DUF2065 family)